MLLQTEQARKLAQNNIVTKLFKIHSEYMGPRRVKVMVCNVPVSLQDQGLASFQSAFSKRRRNYSNPVMLGAGNEDYSFPLCLKRKGFTAIPDTMVYKNWLIILVVEARRPHCWFCQQPRYLAKNCLRRPRKAPRTYQKPPKPC